MSRPYPIGAALVLLNLLECEAERICQPFLAQSEHCSSQANAAADMDVNGIGEVLAGHAARRLALPFHEITFKLAVPGQSCRSEMARQSDTEPATQELTIWENPWQVEISARAGRRFPPSRHRITAISKNSGASAH